MNTQSRPVKADGLHSGALAVPGEFCPHYGRIYLNHCLTLNGYRKTQIAIQYAYWLHEREPKTSIFWVHASNSARFQESFDQIGTMLGMQGIEDPSRNSKLLVHRKLMMNDVGPWLMIVDNADDNHLMYSDPNLARYIPICPHGCIIATTRDRQIAVSMTESRGAVEVPKMEPSESDQLVNKMMSTTEFSQKDKEDVKRLGHTLDYLPLAISQAAAYIHAKSLDIHTYLQIYQQKELEMLSTTFESPGRENLEVPNAVVATWKLSLEWIQSQDSRAVDILSLMAFYDRQGIPSRLLKQENDDMLSFIESRAILINFSLIRWNKIADSYELHRLVHMVIRSWVHEQGRKKEDEVAEDALKNISSAFPEAILDKWTDCAALVPHSRAVLQHQISRPSNDQILQRASLLHKMAQYLLEAGEYTAAKDMEEEAMNLRIAQGGTEDRDTLASMSNLALIYQRQGENDEAERLLVQVTETRILLFGWDHPDSLASLAQLAQLCLATMGPFYATQLFSRALRAKASGDGESIIKPRNRFHILLDLARSYSLEGKLRGAEKLVVKVLDELKTLYGSTDHDSIRAMIDLAGIYAAQDKWDAAQELWTSAMMLSHQLPSAVHPLAFHAMSRLGRAYSLNNRLKEAENLQLKVFLWSKATFGPTHVETQRAAKDLAQTYYLSGDGDLARNIELEVLKAGAGTQDH
jgi:Tfp pilus assembly protein PilF